MTPSESFFISESLRHARTLPHSECVSFLRGLKMLLGDQDITCCEGLSLHSAINALLRCDAQLELIEGAQTHFIDLLNTQK